MKSTPFDPERDPSFRCFGPTSLVAGGAAQPAGGHRERSLLAALLLHPGDHQPVNRLSDALWPNGKPRDPGHALRTLVMRLRRRIAPIDLETTASGYRIVADVEQVDVHRFVRFVNEGRDLVSDGELELGSGSYSMALALSSSGEPWEDLTTSRVGQAAAARMTELRRRTEEDQAELMIRMAKPAVAYLNQLTTEEPLRERRWCLLMIALYQSGRQSEALRAYTEARSILQREIGVDPGPELRETERRVLAQEPMIIS